MQQQSTKYDFFCVFVFAYVECCVASLLRAPHKKNCSEEKLSHVRATERGSGTKNRVGVQPRW